MLRPIIAFSLLSVSLAGCGTLINTENDALSVSERHPITVDQQTVSVTIPVDPTLTGLSRDSLRDLDSFLTAYRTRGHGPVTVTAPSGSERDIDGQQTAADVRAALNAFGLDYAQMQGATYRTNERPGAVIVSFSRYVAAGPVCGIFKGETAARLANKSAPNFGCADQANLAAMIADPRDLTQPQAVAPGNGPSVVNAITLADTPADSEN